MVTMDTRPLGPMEANVMDCGRKSSCDKDEDDFCQLVNSTGLVTSCSVDCCQGELCNSGAKPTKVPVLTVADGGD